MSAAAGNMSLVQIEGFDQLVIKLSRLGDPRRTRSSFIKIMRRVMKPVVKAAKQEAPEGDQPHARYSNGSKVAEYEPGNLKRSIGIIRGRSIKNPVIYVGPRAGKKGGKNDGYYGHLVHWGHINGSTVIPGDPYMERAYKKTGNRLTREAAQKAAQVIQKEIQRLSS
jgi:hypothetical protein